MDGLLPEHLKIVFGYLEPNEKIKLAITGEKYSCDVIKKIVEENRKKALRVICANAFTSLFNFGDEGILFDDKNEMIEEMNSILSNSSQKDRLDMLIHAYCGWISSVIIKRYDYNDMGIGFETIHHHRNRSRYVPEIFAYSPWSFNHELDKPIINRPNTIRVSMVYRVRTFGFQYKTIKDSLLLKALVG